MNIKKTLITLGIVAGAIPVLLCIAWVIFYFGIYIGHGNYKVWGHQEFGRNGTSQIEPAKQVDEIFNGSGHYIVYGANDQPTWNSTVFFGGRYELTMQVPVEIVDKTQGKTVGEPLFVLHEIREVSISPTGQTGASFSNEWKFGRDEWMKVYMAKGDFGVIGIPIRKEPAVKNFEAYVKASRHD